MIDNENGSLGENVAAATVDSSTSTASSPTKAASAQSTPSATRKNILVWGGIVLAILVATAGTAAAFYIRHSVDVCVSQIKDEGSSNTHRNQAPAPSNVSQEQGPSNYEKRAGQRADGDEPSKRPCRWPGVGADRVIAYASLEYAFLGFLVTLLFGTIGVVGIYLTFSLARDEFRRIRP